MQCIICVGSWCWGGGWGRAPQISSSLSKKCRVLYLEPPVSIKNYKAFFKNFYIFNFKRKLKEIDKNLYLFPLIVPFPFGRFKLFKILNNLCLTFIVKRLQKYLKMEKPILLIWDFYEADAFIKKLNEQIVVFDWYDEWSGFFKNKKDSDLAAKKEEEMIRKADIVFVAPKNLYNKAKTINDNTYRISNGVNVENHSNILNDILILQEFKNLPHPIIGYMGSSAFSPHVDYTLIKCIANGHPHWTIAIIGRITEEKEALSISRAFPNIYFLGPKRREELSYYIKRFSVGIIPLTINSRIQRSNPLKLYEYLACGIPIVSTQVSDVVEFANGYPQLVKIAYNYDEFVNKIDESLKENNEILQKKRIEIAKQNSWNNKANEMLRLIREKLF